MIDQLAVFIVDWIIPIGKAFMLFIIVITVLHFVLMAGEAKKKSELISGLFKAIWGSMFAMVKYTGLGIWWFLRFIMRVLHLFFVTVRDFFTSRI